MENKENNYFNQARSLGQKPQNKYFQPAGDLGQESQPDGLAFGNDFSENKELLMEAGSMIVSTEQFEEMVKNGYNITEAEPIGENLVSVSFSFEKRGRTR